MKSAIAIPDGNFLVLSETALSIDPEFIVADDVDGDGNVDLLLGGRRASAGVALGDGAGGFTRPIWVNTDDTGEVSLIAADLNGDGTAELISADANSRQITVSREFADNPANDKVVVFGSLQGDLDVDRFTFNPAGEVRWDIDIDAAEFQMPLDAVLVVRDAAGNQIARSDDAVDRQSGIASVDPYISLNFGSAAFIPSGLLTIEVIGKNGSSGPYRLKLTPGRAMETDAPRVIAVSPDNGATINSTNQILVLLDDLIDPASINSQSVRVNNSAGTRVSGTVTFNPLTAALVFTASATLPVGTYTLTLNGIRDFNGNSLDGETATGFAFPDVSGNGSPGGAFVSSFTVSSRDLDPAAVRGVRYERGTYQRGRITIGLTDQLSLASVEQATFTIRGAGADGIFGTNDDTFAPLDATYDPIAMTQTGNLDLYTRGIPDSGRYRAEGLVFDAAGFTLNLSEEFVVSGVVPSGALFADASLSQPGLRGTYVNESLRGLGAIEDWRTTQPVAGVRTDSRIAFGGSGSFGDQSEVGITGGDDDDWENFSVQWDGFLRVPEDGVQLLTRSEDGSRLLIDLDRNGVFGNLPGEIVDNDFGLQQTLRTGDLSQPLLAGVYPVRLQYATNLGPEAIFLEWVRPNRSLPVEGQISGPSVIRTSIGAGENLIRSGIGPTGDGPISSFSFTFSGAIDTRTLTPDNLFLRRSSDNQFFDADDEIIRDADGIIDWDPSTLTATINFATPLRSGFYLAEVNGEAGGVTNTEGHLLDGEFVSSNIPGNTHPAIWTATPSGDGIPGGTFRSTFAFSPPRLNVAIENTTISEFRGSTNVTVSRLFADDSLPMTIAVSSSDRTELSVPPSVVIPAGQESVTFRVDAVDDVIFDGTQVVSVIAQATGIESGIASLSVTDFETLLMTLEDTAISERGGQTELVLTRSDTSLAQTITLTSSDLTEAIVPPSVNFVVGQRVARVPVTAVDDQILDGTQFVTITSSGFGLVDESVTLQVTDFETLELQLQQTTISENGGTVTGVLRRSDPSGLLSAVVFSDPLGALATQVFVNFRPGQVISDPFVLTAADNNLVDGTRTVPILAQANGYEPASSAINITDFEQLSVVFVQPQVGPGGSPAISELDGQATIRVRRTDPRGALSGTITADPPGSITLPSDFTFADGQLLSGLIVIDAIDDDLLNGSRDFTLTVSAEAYIDGQTTLTVTDHEELTTTLLQANGAPILSNSVPENSSPVFVRVALPRAVEVGSAPAVVFLSTDSPQSIDVPRSAVIRPGDLFVDIPVQPIDNDIVGSNRSLNITAEVPGYISSSVAMTIVEDDVPELSAVVVLPNNQVGSTTNSVPERNGQATLVLTRNTISETTVRFATTPASQFDFPESITFPRGFRRLEVPVRAIDNNVVDGNRSVEITINATGHPQTSVTLNVIDDEIAGIATRDASGASISSPLILNESARDVLAVTSRQIFVSLPAAPVSTVVIEADAGPRLNLDRRELTFTPLNWNQPQPLRITAVDDQRTTGDETVRVNFRVIPSRSDPAFGSVVPIARDVTLIDDDTPAIEIIETGGTTFASEIGLEDQFGVRLQTQPTAPVTLRFDSSHIESVSVVPNIVTFTPENWNIPRFLNVQTDLDFDADGHEIGLVFIDVSGSAVGYNAGLGRRRLSVVHVDSNLSDLRIRRENNDVVLVDQVTQLEFLRQPIFGSVFTTGSRSETLTVDPGMGLDTIRLDTAGGDDTIIVNAPSRVDINGADGYDTLKLRIPGFRYEPDLFVAAQNPTHITVRNIEEIDTRDHGTQTLVLTSESVRAMTDERNDLFLRVGPEDALVLGNEWTVQAPVLRDGIPSHRLTSGDVTLRLVAGAAFQNPLNPFDVNRSGTTSSLDPLLIINRLNAEGEAILPNRFEGESFYEGERYYYDVNGDGAVTSLDALQVINYLNMIEQIASASSEPLGDLPLPQAASIVVLPQIMSAPIAPQPSGIRSAADSWSDHDRWLIETLDDSRTDSPVASLAGLETSFATESLAAGTTISRTALDEVFASASDDGEDGEDDEEGEGAALSAGKW